MVSLLVAEPDTRVFDDPFFAGIVRGATQELNRAGVDLVLSMAQSSTDLERLEGFLRRGHVDGALVISDHRGLDVVSRARSAAIPVVMGGRPFEPSAGIDFVDNDNIGGGALAIRRLRELGRTRIATIAGPQDMVAGVDRLTGFRNEMGAGFDPALVEIGDFTRSGGAAAVDRLLSRSPDLDGLFVASDTMALGAMNRLAAAGRSIPGDVAVVGFDDSPVAAAATPALTTVRQRTQDQGRLMAQLLLLRLGHRLTEVLPELEHDAGGVVLDVELVPRQSG